MTLSDFQSFEIGPIRPPSEGGGNSLLLRITRNCPWGRCKFCFSTLYDHQKFELRPVEEVKKDIRTVAAISSAIKSASWKLGQGGMVNPIVSTAIIRGRPDLRWDHSFVTVFNWLTEGGRTVFLQDADSMIMKTEQLVDIISYLKLTLPSLERITTYARAKTIYRKSPEELESLRAAGLVRLHIGLETGDDELLTLVDKGVTSEQHIIAGQKAKASGFQISEYVMPDLGGRERWQQHARNTARVLSAIDPDYIRFRPFVPRKGTPLFDDYVAGRIHLSSPHQRLEEIRLLVEGLNIKSHVCFDHFANAWVSASGQSLFTRDYEGYKFPEEKQLVLDLIEEGLAIDEASHMDVTEMIKLGRM
jgi:radical SAM superfamily enzyme YgiQ (UPF0313 family)